MAEESSPRNLLLAFVRSQSVSCPVCGEDLKDMAASVCPHCQSELILSVAPVRSGSGIWLGAAILLFLNAGIGLLFGIALLGSLMQKEPIPSQQQYHYQFMWMYIACIPVAIAFLFTRRLFVYLGSGSQILALLIACGITVGGIAWIVLSK
jgi:hypothetical protein